MLGLREPGTASGPPASGWPGAGPPAAGPSAARYMGLKRIQESPDFNDVGFILTDFCTDFYDGKQLTIATYLHLEAEETCAGLRRTFKSSASGVRTVLASITTTTR